MVDPDGLDLGPAPLMLVGAGIFALVAVAAIAAAFRILSKW